MSRLNPFPFPSDTSLRFGLLIIFVLCGSFNLYGNLWQVFHSSEDQATTAGAFRMFSQQLNDMAQLSDPQIRNQKVMNDFAERTMQEVSHYAQLLGPQQKWQLGGVWLTVGLAMGIYWFFPSWKIWRERLQPLSAEDPPGVADELRGLCQQAELSPYPAFVWNPLKLDFPSAFGRRGRYYVALSGAFITRFFYTDRDAFRAIILHELAHLRNADVDKTYFTIAVFWAFMMVAFVPSAAGLAAGLLWYGLSSELLSHMLWQICLSTALVMLTGLAVLRVREYYADVRASVWDGTSANLDRVLAALPPLKAGRWRQIFRFHPDSTERQQTLKDTYRLFRLSFWDAFGIGIAVWIAIRTVQGAALIFLPAVPQQLPYFMLLLLGAMLGIPLCFMAMAVGAVGIAVWRGTFAALIRGQRMDNPGRLGFALVLGYVYTSGVVAVTAIAEKSVPSNVVAFMAATAVFGAVLLLMSFFLIFKWIAAAVSAWLEVILQSGSPRPALIISLVIAIGLVVAWVGMAVWAPLFYLFFHTRNEFPIYVGILIWGPAICLSSAMLWAFPLAAWFWRKRAAYTSSSTWAFLDGPSDVPRQAPLCPGLALLIGVATGGIFCLMLALVYFSKSLPSQVGSFIHLFFVYAKSSLEEAYGSNMGGLIIWGPAAMLQAIAAAIAASGRTRLSALHGMFAAFIAGLVMAIGNYLLLGNHHQSLYETLLIFAVFLGAGALLALPITLAVAAIAGWIPPSSLQKTRLWVGGSLAVAFASVLIVFFLSRTLHPPSKMMAIDFVNKGEAKLSKQDYTGALADYTQAITLAPMYARAYKNRAYAHYALHDYAAALADFTQVITLTPQDAQAYNNRGETRAGLRDYQGALADFTQAITLTPTYARAYNNRGETHHALRDYAAALADHTQAITLAPQDARAYNDRGAAHAALRDHAAALVDFTQAITLTPTYARAYNNRAYAHYALHDYAAALADFTQVITLTPQDAEAYNNRGETHYALHDYAAALADHTQAITLNPMYALAYNDRGAAHAALRDHAAALVDYTQAITLAPTYARAYNNRAYAHYALHDYAAALADFTQVITLTPQDAQAYRNRGETHYALHDYAAALADYQKAVDLYQQQGKTSDYQEALNRIIELQR